MSAASIPVAQIKTITMSIYRYDPTVDKKPYMQDIVVEIPTDKDIMVLDALHLAKEQEPSLSYRRSCREGVCGSDGMNINGKNGLACVTPLSEVLKRNKITLRPMPGLPVVRDLIVDMKQFFDQLEKVKPYLITKSALLREESRGAHIREDFSSQSNKWLKHINWKLTNGTLRFSYSKQ